MRAAAVISRILNRGYEPIRIPTVDDRLWEDIRRLHRLGVRRLVCSPQGYAYLVRAMDKRMRRTNEWLVGDLDENYLPFEGIDGLTDEQICEGRKGDLYTYRGEPLLVLADWLPVVTENEKIDRMMRV